MVASYKFIQKFWLLHKKIIEKIAINEKSEDSKSLANFTNTLIDKITKNLEKFHYNVIVANFYETYNFLNKEIEKPIKKEVLIDNYKKILILMNPFIPHFTSECLGNFEQNQVSWPIVAAEELVEEIINFVVQINGKKKGYFKG